MMKSRENAKKPVFRHFRPEYMFFENWAPPHFRYCRFASVCKISWKNIKYSSRSSRNTVFRWKSAVRAIFREFRLQKSVLLTIEPCLMVGIVINNVFVWKKQRNQGKSPIKICNNSDFRYIFGIFGRKKNFLKNRTRPCFEHS